VDGQRRRVAAGGSAGQGHVRAIGARLGLDAAGQQIVLELADEVEEGRWRVIRDRRQQALTWPGLDAL